MHERRFNREIERLRDPQRVARMEITRVIELSLAGLASRKTVLDVGTGSGLFAEQFAALGFEVTGLDVDPEMLAAAKEFVPSATFHEGIAEKLPFQDGSFDLVFMGLLLHETDDLLAALTEAYRVTAQRLAVLEWPDEEQTMGPPRDHRLPYEKVLSQSKEAGFSAMSPIRLENLVLYLFDR